MNTMLCLSTYRRTAWVVTAIAVGLLGSVHAQQPVTTSPSYRVIGATVLRLNVANLDESLAFYRDVLGMEKYEDGAMRAGEFLGGEPGGKLRSARVRVPGDTFAMELVEWSGVPLRPEHRNFNDPGAIMLAFDVRSFDTKLAAARKLGFQVISKNGEPESGSNRRSIMLHDPNGYIVEGGRGAAQ